MTRLNVSTLLKVLDLVLHSLSSGKDIAYIELYNKVHKNDVISLQQSILKVIPEGTKVIL